MRVAFVSIPRFACAVEEQRDPRLAGRPLIVGDAEQPRKVLDCSFPAAGAGVREGMTIRNALGMCPEAAIVAPDPVLYRDRWEGILTALDEISPEIEPLAPGRAYVNVHGLERLYRDERDLAVCMNDAVRAASGLRAVAGLAGGKFPALAAAVTAGDEDACIIPAGAEAAFLAPLDVALLPVEPETVLRLQLLGLTSIGERRGAVRAGAAVPVRLRGQAPVAAGQRHRRGAAATKASHRDALGRPLFRRARRRHRRDGGSGEAAPLAPARCGAGRRAR